MNQKQCKRQRKAIKKLDTERARYWRVINYLERRPPVWRLVAYIKWRMEGRKTFQ